MKRIRPVVLLCCLMCFLFSLLPAAAQADCAAVPAPRLTVGEQGRVTPGNANNVRAQAGRSAALVGQIPGGEVFDVVGGPQCADGLNWWEVRYGSLEGWTVEAVGLDYWLEPYEPAVPTILTPSGEIDYEFEGIRFEVDPAFAATVTAAHLAPVVDDPYYDPPSPVAPSGIGFTFADGDGKAIPFTIRVFSVAAYKQAYEFAEQAVNDLSALLADNPGWLSVEYEQRIPMLGVVDPPLLMRARVNELGFANGSGYRFLAQYSFDVREISNPLTYYFTGVTHDEQYYIIAKATVTTPLLADRAAPQDADFERNFEAYRDAVIDDLTHADNEAFNINLSLLDNVLQSLQVKGQPFNITTEDGHTQVSYGKVSFSIASNLAADIDYQVSPANWESMSPLPEHVCFSMQQDRLSHAWSGRQLCIIPTDGMDDYVKALNRILDGKPAFTAPDGRTRIPIPFNGAAQLMHAQVNYIETGWLKGVGFVSAYAQTDYPIRSGSTEYNFSGLSNDGKYLIYLEYPLHTNRLPDGPPGDDEVARVNRDPLTYYQSVVDLLNAASPADFTPNLGLLTAWVESIHTD